VFEDHAETGESITPGNSTAKRADRRDITQIASESLWTDIDVISSGHT
jgi:hypothetical protein